MPTESATSGSELIHRLGVWSITGAIGYLVVAAPQHFLYFLPLPQEQGSLRPGAGMDRRGAWPAVLSRRVWHARRFRVCLRGIVGPLAPAGQHNARNLRDPDDTAEFNKHIGWERFLRRIRARRETTRPDRVAGLNL